MHDLFTVETPDQIRYLPTLDHVRTDLAKVFRVEDLLDRNRKTDAVTDVLKRLAKRLKDRALFRYAVSVRWETRRRIGQVLLGMEAWGELAGRGDRKCSAGRTFQTLDEIGVPRKLAMECKWI